MLGIIKTGLIYYFGLDFPSWLLLIAIWILGPSDLNFAGFVFHIFSRSTPSTDDRGSKRILFIWVKSLLDGSLLYKDFK